MPNLVTKIQKNPPTQIPACIQGTCTRYSVILLFQYFWTVEYWFCFMLLFHLSAVLQPRSLRSWNILQMATRDRQKARAFCNSQQTNKPHVRGQEHRAGNLGTAYTGRGVYLGKTPCLRVRHKLHFECAAGLSSLLPFASVLR